MALYIAPVASLDAMMKNSTPEDQKKGMDAWMKWMQDNKAVIADHGAPLGKTKTVSKDGGIADTRNGICGYTIVNADSGEAAAEIFKTSPHLAAMDGATIDVIECMAMPDSN